jgi:hypothetical protein
MKRPLFFLILFVSISAFADCDSGFSSAEIHNFVQAPFLANKQESSEYQKRQYDILNCPQKMMAAASASDQSKLSNIMIKDFRLPEKLRRSSCRKKISMQHREC